MSGGVTLPQATWRLLYIVHRGAIWLHRTSVIQYYTTAVLLAPCVDWKTSKKKLL